MADKYMERSSVLLGAKEMTMKITMGALSHLLQRLKFKSLSTPNAGEGGEEQELTHFLGRAADIHTGCSW